MNLFPWDDINALEAKAERIKQGAQTEDYSKAVEDYIDEVTELFEMDYMYGVQDVSMQLGRSIDPDFRELEDALNKTFDGKGYKDRLNEYFKDGTSFDIARVVATDAHRIYNEAMYNAAVKGGAKNKTWHTMQDPRVRDLHDYLEGVTVSMDSEFFTYNGDHTYYPGQFGIPEEDCGCRCWVTYS